MPDSSAGVFMTVLPQTSCQVGVAAVLSGDGGVFQLHSNFMGHPIVHAAHHWLKKHHYVTHDCSDEQSSGPISEWLLNSYGERAGCWWGCRRPWRHGLSASPSFLPSCLSPLSNVRLLLLNSSKASYSLAGRQRDEPLFVYLWEHIDLLHMINFGLKIQK